jgi:hypothetical protein
VQLESRAASGAGASVRRGQASLELGLLAIAFATLAGCKPTGEGGRARQFFAERDGVLCAKAFSCCTPTDPWRGAIGSPEECFDLSPNGSRAAELEQALDSGLAALDEAALEACLDTLRAASCEVMASIASGDEPAECRGIVTGARLKDETCASDFECASRNCRRADPSDRTSTRRICGDVATEAGGGCGASQGGVACLPPLVCDSGSGSSLSCRTPLAGGVGCNHDSDCLSQFCDPTTKTCSPVCRVPLESDVLTLR